MDKLVKPLANVGLWGRDWPTPTPEPFWLKGGWLGMMREKYALQGKEGANML